MTMSSMTFTHGSESMGFGSAGYNQTDSVAGARYSTSTMSSSALLVAAAAGPNDSFQYSYASSLPNSNANSFAKSYHHTTTAISMPGNSDTYSSHTNNDSHYSSSLPTSHNMKYEPVVKDEPSTDFDYVSTASTVEQQQSYMGAAFYNTSIPGFGFGGSVGDVGLHEDFNEFLDFGERDSFSADTGQEDSFKCSDPARNVQLPLKTCKVVNNQIWCEKHVPNPKAIAVADSVSVMHARHTPKKAAEGLHKARMTPAYRLDNFSTQHALNTPDLLKNNPIIGAPLSSIPRSNQGSMDKLVAGSQQMRIGDDRNDDDIGSNLFWDHLCDKFCASDVGDCDGADWVG
ncbi:hypothetical protein HK104_001467 [Borealophlyctis nickersoniae]|nr:hypothetical protein HK104_001467 [Borealophlyctis nickersoniae]